MAIRLQGPGDARKGFPVSSYGIRLPFPGDQRKTGDKTKSGDREGGGPSRAQAFPASQRRSDAVPDVENRVVGIDRETSLGLVNSQPAKRDGRLA